MTKKKIIIRILCLCLAAIFFTACGSASSAAADPERVIADTAQYLMKENPNPVVSAQGGDWIIKGLAASGTEVPREYYDLYYDNVRAAVKSQKGVLSTTHYTEYMRVMIALQAIGKDPSDVEGYDLTPYLDDAEKVTAQGVNASSWALTAANVCGIKLENEQVYLDDILTELSTEKMKQEKAYADYLGIGLAGLSFYQDRPEVRAFIDGALEELSAMQKENGSFFSSESTMEVIVALTQLGIDPCADERFIKNGNDVRDGLMLYYAGNGRFKHLAEEKDANEFATEKALIALAALKAAGSGGIYG